MKALWGGRGARAGLVGAAMLYALAYGTAGAASTARLKQAPAGGEALARPVSTAPALRLGDRVERAFTVLGEPTGSIAVDDRTTYFFERGEVTARGGYIVRLMILTEEEVRAEAERRETAAREAADRVARGKAAKESLLADPRYHALSPVGKVNALRSLNAHYPDLDLETELRVQSALAEETLAQDRRVAEAERKAREAQAKAEDADRRAARAEQERDQAQTTVRVTETYVPFYYPSRPSVVIVSPNQKHCPPPKTNPFPVTPIIVPGTHASPVSPIIVPGRQLGPVAPIIDLNPKPSGSGRGGVIYIAPGGQP